MQKRAEKLNYALAVLLSAPGTPLAPLSPAALHPCSPGPPLLALLSSPSSNSSSSRTGNRQIFCYLRINIFIEFASVESEREGGGLHPRVFGFTRSQRGTAWTPFGHLFFGPVKNCVNMLVISTCLSLCAVVHLALDKQTDCPTLTPSTTFLPPDSNPAQCALVALLSACAPRVLR